MCGGCPLFLDLRRSGKTCRVNNPVGFLVGLVCSGVVHRPDSFDWVFSFSDGTILTVSAPWRLLSSEAITLGYEDHGQLFGYTTPVNGEVKALSILGSGPIASASTDLISGDLEIRVGDSRLQIFNSSCGYEGWELWGSARQVVIGQSGGR